MFIKAKNGTVVETDDPDLGRRALKQGHEVYESDPRGKGAKPKSWKPKAEVSSDDDSE